MKPLTKWTWLRGLVKMWLDWVLLFALFAIALAVPVMHSRPPRRRSNPRRPDPAQREHGGVRRADELPELRETLVKGLRSLPGRRSRR